MFKAILLVFITALLNLCAFDSALLSSALSLQISYTWSNNKCTGKYKVGDHSAAGSDKKYKYEVDESATTELQCDALQEKLEQEQNTRFRNSMIGVGVVAFLVIAIVVSAWSYVCCCRKKDS